MENYISLIVALLENLGHLSEKEAVKLDKELRNTTLPGTYKEAKILVSDLVEKVKLK